MTDARMTVAERGLTARASGHLTETVAVQLEFEQLGPFKTLLKRFFSTEPWTAADATALSDIVTPALAEGRWDHRLDDDLTLRHGVADGSYFITVDGPPPRTNPLFARVFSGPVTPEATPHPHKVKFDIGGTAAPGVWYRREDEVDDDRVAAMLEADDITDVMVAGDFVTVGLARSASWEDRLDAILDRVTELFYDPNAPAAVEPERTRDELVGEGLRTATPAELHLLDPDDPGQRQRLQAALTDASAEVRRVALATLAQSADSAFVADLLTAAYADEHRIVRRMAIDGAADIGAEELRELLERALGDDDAWTRWKAVRGLREMGLGSSRDAVAALGDDEDFQVQFEVAAALRS